MLDESLVTAGELMTRDVAVIHPEMSLLAAVTLMARRRVSGLPVVDDSGALIGMLTEGDLIRWHEGSSEKGARWLEMLAEGNDLAPTFLEAIRAERNKVRSAMSSGAITVDEKASAREIAGLMYSKGIKRVPVVREGRLVGIIARSDLVRALAEKLQEKPLPTQEKISLNEALRRGRE